MITKITTSKRFDAGYCLWNDTAIAGTTYPELVNDISCDVVIVGGGLTGTRTALGLAECGVDVALIDARHIGWGASGRSGGQCNPLWRMTPDELRLRLGQTIANNLIATTIESANALFSDIERYSIDCDPIQAGWVQTAHCARSAASLMKLYESWAAEGASIKLLEADDVVRETGAQGYEMGLRHATGGHVHPLSMTRGFAACAAQQGAKMYDETSALSIRKNKERWQVVTPKSVISCERIVVTINAYTSDLIPDLGKSIMPMVTIVVATEPLSGNAADAVLPGSVTISDSRRAILYGRLDRDRRLVFGCMGSSEVMEQFGGLKRLTAGLRSTFPVLEDVAITHHWAGRIAMTQDFMPHLYEPLSGVIAALGYSGRGIVNTSVMSKAIIKRLMGTDYKDLPFPIISKIKKIPLHRACLSLLPLLPPALAMCDRMDHWKR